MAATFVVSTKFSAIDAMTATFKQMSSSLGRLDAQMSSFERGIGKAVGVVGQLGIAIGTISIGKNIIDANVQLDDALKSLSAITGITGAAFEDFKSKIEETSKSSKMFKGDVAKAYEVVGNAAPEFLKNASALKSVTEASITLSKASKEDLQSSALSLTGVMNQFNLGAEQSARTMNALAAGSVVGSASIKQVNEAMVNFGAVASESNMSLETSVALIEVLSKKSIFGAEAGTKLRGATIKLKDAGLGYKSGLFNINDALEEAKKKYDKLSSAKRKDAFLTKTFGIENITTGTILLNNIGLLNEYTKGVTGTNTATEQAAIQSQSLGAIIKRIGDGFKNFVTSTNDSNLALSAFRNVLIFVDNNLGTLLATIGLAIGVYAALKVAIMVNRAWMLLSNVAIGISNALHLESTAAIAGNTIAMNASIITEKLMTAWIWLSNTAMANKNIATLVLTTQTIANTIATNANSLANMIMSNSVISATVAIIASSSAFVWNKISLIASTVATYAFTAATWVLNTALTIMNVLLSPISLIIIGIGAAIVGVLYVISNWGNIVKWLGNIWTDTINMITRAWTGMIKWFKEFDFVDMFKSIGNSIINFFLWPIKKVLELVSSFPGKIGATAKSGLDTLNGLQFETKGEMTKKVVNVDAASNTAKNQQNNSSVDINLRAEKGTSAEILKNKGATPIKVTKNN
jgi:TP901 family phage tail tape measure protein